MAMNFTRSGNDLISSQSNLTPATSGTISLWLRRASTGSIQTFFYVDSVFKIEFHSDDTVKSTLFRSAPKATESSATITSTSLWYNVLCYYNNSGTNAICINGALDTSDSQTVSTPDAGKMYFGCAGLNSEHFDGDLDDIRLYDRILTLTEIKNIYESKGHDGIIKGLLHRYMLDEESAGNQPNLGAIKDQAGTNNLSFTNSPSYSTSILTPRRMV